MIWTIMTKELREHGKWFVLGAVVAMFYLYTDVVRGHGEISRVILHIAIVAGVVLGLLQTLPEKFLGLFPFLTHRPMTLTSIFVAKVTAALILFSITVIIPLFMTIMIVSDEMKMLIHDVDAQIVIHMLFGVIAYFLTIVIALREARFYGSRVVGILCGIICYYVAYEAPTKGHLAVFMLGITCIVISCAWGIFTNKQSRIAKMSMGIVLLISYIVVTTFIFHNVEVITKQFSAKVRKFSTNIYYRVTSQGPIAIEKKENRIYRDKDNNILSAKQVDKIYEEELLSMYLLQIPITNARYLTKQHYVRLTSDFYYSKLQKRILAYNDSGVFQGSIGIDGFHKEQVGSLHKEDYFDHQTINKKLLIQTQRELHLFDSTNKTIKVLFSSPETIHKFHVAISEKDIPTEIIVVTEKRLYILDKNGNTIAQIEHLPLQDYDKTKILLTTKKQYIFRYIKTNSQQDRVVEYSQTGKIVKQYTVPKNPEYIPQHTWETYFIKSSILSNFLCELLLPHASLPDYKLSLLWLVIVPTLLCFLIAQFYAVSTHETICWLAICCIAGIPGLLTFLSMCHFAVVLCETCNKKRNLQNELCGKCSAKPNKPAADGTEIFA